MRSIIKSLVIVALTILSIQPGQAGTIYARGETPPESLQHRQEELNPPGKPKKGDDIRIGVDPDVKEFNPTVAASPVDPNKLVAGSQYYIGDTTRSCVVYTSADAGMTWSAPVPVPMLSAISTCSNPVVAYAPDGSRAYYAYMDVKVSREEVGINRTTIIDWDILIRTSLNNGNTWTEPVIALDGAQSTFVYDTVVGEYIETYPGFNYFRPWIATPLHAAEKDWVYVTATRRDSDVENPEPCYISFASSSDGSATWSEPVILDQTADLLSCGGYGNPQMVDGARVAGGTDGNVLVAWYHPGSDGAEIGEFAIRTRTSPDHGVTWNEIVTAVTDSYEPWLHFNSREAHFPDVELDARGGAHIAYTHDPTLTTEGLNDIETGDIRYIQSSGAPYDTWSRPVTVNDDGLIRTQGWAALETQTVKKRVYVYLMWADFRLSPEPPIDNPQSEPYYDIYAAWKRADSSKWSPNRRITDTSSLWSESFISIGEYFDITANPHFAYGVWTDRREITDPNDPKSDVFGSRIVPIR